MTAPADEPPQQLPEGFGSEPGNSPHRKDFEQWYVTHSFDLVASPLGSRDSVLQWAAWLTASAKYQATPQAATGAPDARAVPLPAEDAYPALQALTEAVLTHADADYMQRQLAEAVRIMATRGWVPPVPFHVAPASGASLAGQTADRQAGGAS